MTIVRAPRARTSWMLDTILSCSTPRPRGDGTDGDDREARLDQGDRAVLQLAGREALGVHVGELLQLERALERDRIADVPAEEQHRASVGERSGQLAHRLHRLQHLRATLSGIRLSWSMTP